MNETKADTDKGLSTTTRTTVISTTSTISTVPYAVEYNTTADYAVEAIETIAREEVSVPSNTSSVSMAANFTTSKETSAETSTTTTTMSTTESVVTNISDSTETTTIPLTTTLASKISDAGEDITTQADYNDGKDTSTQEVIYTTPIISTVSASKGLNFTSVSYESQVFCENCLINTFTLVNGLSLCPCSGKLADNNNTVADKFD